MPSDPVCGMEVDVKRAAGTRTHNSTKFYFCSPECVAKFDKDPHRYGHEH